MGPGMVIYFVGEIKYILHETYEPTKCQLPPEDHIAFEVLNDQAISLLSQ